MPETPLFLPVESVARELDGKLLLALAARARGFRPVLGFKSTVRQYCGLYPPGIFLRHHVRGGVNHDDLEAFGHRLAVLDEEALVRQTDAIYLAKHTDDALQRVKLLLAWGDSDAQLWRDSGWADGCRIVATGNPRCDMLRPELRAFHRAAVDNIHRRFPRYVLLNTNFPTVNHLIAGFSTLRLSRNEPAMAQQTEGLLAHKRALLEAFLDAVPYIARSIAPAILVIRPHPSENPQPWLDVAAAAGHAAVVQEGSVVPWIIGACAVLHNGCTSAVEAAIIGTPVITYRPVRSETFDNPLPNALGIECTNRAAILDALGEVLQNERGQPGLEESRRLAHHVAALAGPLACERILDALGMVRPDDPALSAFTLAGRRAGVALKQAARRIDRAINRETAARSGYYETKFPRLDAAFMNAKLAAISNALPRFAGGRAIERRTNLFEIV